MVQCARNQDVCNHQFQTTVIGQRNGGVGGGTRCRLGLEGPRGHTVPGHTTSGMYTAYHARDMQLYLVLAMEWIK